MFALTQTTRTLPRSLRGLPYESMKDEVLGKAYNLSLVFIGDTLSRRLNNTYRSKDKPTDVLSFTLDKKNGEIFINVGYARKKSHLYEKNLTEFVGFLFIHGLFHLKGMDHGSRMEKAEKKILTKFKKSFNDSPSHRRN